MANEQIGSWAFILGVLIAVIVGLVGTYVALGAAAQWMSLVLVILGFVVGFINISIEELNDFLTAGIALIVVSVLGASANLLVIPYIGLPLAGMFGYIVIFATPAVLIVSLKGFYNLARSV